MEDLIRKLTALIQRGLPAAAPRARPDLGAGPASPREVEVDLADAPKSVVELANALASNFYFVRLGALKLYENGAGDSVSTLAGTLEQACERGGIDPEWVRTQGGPNGAPFDPERTLELGADGGGMSYFGVSWSGGTLGLVLVEFEDPVQDNLLVHFATPEELFAFLDEKNEGEQYPDLIALRS